MKVAFITGVSSGIGYELTKELLIKNYVVYGVSRRIPKELGNNANFHHLCVDLSHLDKLSDLMHQLFTNPSFPDKIDYVFLNAGEFNKRITLISDTPIAEYEYLMRVNVWSCKIILDVLLRCNKSINTVILSSSIASIRARKGMGPYSVTKSALNMLAKLYALDHPDIFFSVLGLCNVDTFLATNVIKLPLLGEFPELNELRKRAEEKGYMVPPALRASQIMKLLEGDLKKRTTSGDFFEIRNLL